MTQTPNVHQPHNQPPIFKDDPMYRLLREGRIEAFNEQRTQGKEGNLRHCDFRNADLRGLDARGVDFSGAYFRQADLRGVDLSQAHLEGASLHSAKIAGCYFPPELPAEEITMSLHHGTRMRYRRG